MKETDMAQDDAAAARRRSIYTFGIAFIASIGGFLFGYDLSIIGAANLFLRDQFHLSNQAFGFTTASAALGCIIGPFVGAWLCDAIGRERTMIVASAILAVGATMTALARDIVTFNAFRILCGVAVGLCSIASPMYIAEVAPSRRRGRLGIMYQLAIVVGSTIAPLAAALLVRILPDTVSWRWMFGSQMLAVVPFAFLVLILPRSPRWLARQGRFDEAQAVLTRVDGEAYGRRELDEIKESLAQEKGGLAELLQPGIRYALLIGLLLAFFNNWTGWSVIGGYIPMLFEMAGETSRFISIMQYFVTYLFMAILTLVAIGLVDRAGRRPLWLVASALMAVITALAGLIFHQHLRGPIVLAVILLCAMPHGLALGPLPWLMMSEIFPNRIRAKMVAVTTTFLWITIFLGAQLFPLMTAWSEKTIGSPAGAFWILTFIDVLAFVFGWTMLPETKGRTLEAIAASWGKRAKTAGS